MASEYFTSGTYYVADGTTVRASQLNNALDSLETGLDKLPTEAEIKKGLINYAADTGSVNAIEVALPYTATAYTDGMRVCFKAAYTNTSASVTINVDALGAVALKRQNGDDLLVGDIVSDRFYECWYNADTLQFDLIGTIGGALGAGTMSLQNSNSVAITGGTISGVAITGSTFSGTSLAIDNISVNGNTISSTSGSLSISAPASSEVVINDAGDDVDFRVEASGTPNALFVQGNTGSVGIGENSPEGTQGLTINQGANDDIILSLKSSDVAHSVTAIAQADTFFFAKKLYAANGGALLQGLSDTDATGLQLTGTIGSIDPTDTTPAIILNANKRNAGTGQTNLAATETALVVQNDGNELIIVFGGGDVNIPNDNAKLQIGAGQDLQLYHDGTDSYVANTATGKVYLRNDVSGEDVGAVFTSTGKFTVARAGQSPTLTVEHEVITVVGALNVSADNKYITVGAGDDGKFYHDGTDTYISNATGNLYLYNATDGEDVAALFTGAGKFTVARAGQTPTLTVEHEVITVVGALNVSADNKYISAGVDEDVAMYHDGTNSYIRNATGNLYIYNTVSGADNTAVFTDDGKFTVARAGQTPTLTVEHRDVTVTGEISAGGDVGLDDGSRRGFHLERQDHTETDKNGMWIGNYSSGSAPEYWENVIIGAGGSGNLVFLTGSSQAERMRISSTGNTVFQNHAIVRSDSASVIVGAGDDASFYHDGSNTYVKNSTGNLYLYNATDGGDTAAVFTGTGHFTVARAGQSPTLTVGHLDSAFAGTVSIPGKLVIPTSQPAPLGAGCIWIA